MDSETRAGSSVMKKLSSAQRREIRRLPLVGRYKPDVGLRICHQCEQSWAKTCFQASQKAVCRNKKRHYFNCCAKQLRKCNRRLKFQQQPKLECEIKPPVHFQSHKVNKYV